MQLKPCCAKAAEARLSLDVCRASRKRSGYGSQGSGPHQACPRRLMLLLLSATQSISFCSAKDEHFSTRRATIPRLPVLTLVNTPSSINSCLFNLVSTGTGTGTYDDFLCKLGSVLISKVMSLWCYSISIRSNLVSVIIYISLRQAL